MEISSSESRRLRRSMRDLVALAALPAVWAGYRPLEVAEGLADVLLRAQRLNLVYIRLPGQAERPAIEVARTAAGPTSAEQTRNIRQALASLLDGAAVHTLPNPIGTGVMQVVVVPVGCGGTDGTLIAGRRQTAFPREEDRLLLSMAANQVAAVLQRERDEETLRESEARYRSVIAAMQEAVVLMGADGRIRASNTSAERILGLSADEMMGRTTFDPRWQAIHEDGSAFPGEEHPVTVTLHTGRPRSNVVMGIRKPSGELTWISINSQPLLRDNEVTPYAVVASFSDITERKNTEQALRQSEQRWRLLSEALPQLVWTATPDGALEYSSAQTVQYMGRPESELLGWGWLDTLHPDDRERTDAAWRAAVESGHGEYEIEHRFRRFDGSYRWFKTRGVAMRDGEGDIYKWFGTCTDVTTDKQLEEQLRQAKEAAEAANRAKDEFLANVSHEIRTPMNAILGMTDLALDTELTEPQRKCLKTVKSAADNLLAVINDLLDFAKIEAGKLELAPIDFSLRTTVGDTVRALAVRAHKKELELICHVHADVPDALIGDAGRLRQVLLNLVGNAVKFTENGEVEVRVSVDNETRRQGDNEKGRPAEDETTAATSVSLSPCLPVSLSFAVRDTGIGIPRDEQQRIFRAFEQQDTSTTRRYGGTGLGLTISSRLVALMGGKIKVDSEPGKGSSFTFTAEFETQPQPPAALAARASGVLHDLPVLIVDNNATNRHLLEEWLQGWRLKPEAVSNGLAAMDALWRGKIRGRPYALVLLDAHMPDVDGLALAAMIRERTELSATRMILLSAGDRPGELSRLRELRVEGYLLKPLQQEELLEAIYQVMSCSEGELPPAAAPVARAEHAVAPAPETTPLHVLVAEDNEFNAELLEQLLGRRGHRVRLANNGREALRLAEEAVDDLLLLDVHMPELDGFQVVRSIRERERTTGNHLPIIALTARSRREDRERCLAAGMDDFLAKPIQSGDLWAAMDRIVPARPRAERPGAGLLDPQVLLAACASDADILAKICQAFRASVPRHLETLQEALRDQDGTRLREAAHKLSGMVPAFSTVAGSVASELEDRAAQGQLEEARVLVARLRTMAGELICLAEKLSLDALREHAENASATVPAARR